MPKLDVIIPIYNVEGYLKRSLDSVLAQTFEDINIICVDDGSSDHSAEILKEYEKKDNRIKVITQQNQGLAAARNSGLKNSSSELIMFLDSDDYYHPQMCEKMYNAITENDVDIAVCDVEVIFDSEYKNIEHEIDNNWGEYLKLSFKGKETITNEIIETTNVLAWNKIYKRAIIEKYNIEFPKGLIFEDNPFFFSYMSVSKTVFHLNEKLYYYFRHSDTIMAEVLGKRKVGKFDLILNSIYYYKFLMKNNLFDQNKTTFWFYFLRSFEVCFGRLNSEERKEAAKLCYDFLSQFNNTDFKKIKNGTSKTNYKRLCHMRNLDYEKLETPYIKKRFLINFKGYKFIRIK